MGVDITRGFHPLIKRKIDKEKDSVYGKFVSSINKELSQTEEELIRSKAQLYLSEAQDSWLDLYGKWLGLHRKATWDDETYRNRLINHVLHARDTIDSLRSAIADFLDTNKNNIFIYEPYHDIFYYNYSLLNTMSFYPDTFYNFYVIEIQIDAPYTNEINKIINLFRPAGILYVVTEMLHSYDPDSPIYDMSMKQYSDMEIDTTLYCNFDNFKVIKLTPILDDDIIVKNPFIYSDINSLWNNGREYMNGKALNSNYLTFGERIVEPKPDKSRMLYFNTSFNDTREEFKPHDRDDNALDSWTDDGRSLDLEVNDENSVALGGLVDVKRATQILDNIVGTVNDNKLGLTIYQDYENVYLTFKAKVEDNLSHDFDFIVYNGETGISDTLATFTLTNKYSVFNYKFSDLTNYIDNNKGVLVYAFVPHDSVTITVDTDFIGFTMERIIDKRNPMLNTFNEWHRGLSADNGYNNKSYGNVIKNTNDKRLLIKTDYDNTQYSIISNSLLKAHKSISISNLDDTSSYTILKNKNK